jgi:hypothetical protein
MKERFKRYRTKKEVALDKLGKIDKMAKLKPSMSATEVFKRPPYSVCK